MLEKNSSECDEMLKLPQDQLMADTLDKALMAAVRSGNHQNVIKVLLREPGNLDEAIAESSKLGEHAVTAVLLAAKAAVNNDVTLLVSLWRREKLQAMGLDPEVCQCVVTGAVRLVFALELARRHKSAAVRTELLLKTDGNYSSHSVIWFGLKLHRLEITWFRRITWAKNINLAKNRLGEFPSVICQYLRHCTLLNLQNNSLKEIPAEVVRMPCLNTLVLCHNQLQWLPAGTWSPALLSADFSHNQLATLPDFRADRLNELHLAHNNLIEVPSWLAHMTRLAIIDLSYNASLSSLPPQLSTLKNLTKLSLEHLPGLVSPPKTLHSNTVKSIAFLKGQLSPHAERYQMKMVVMGDTATGKSTLVNLLCGRDVKLINGVTGAAISKMKHSSNKSLPPICFSVWDLSGYHDYHAAHECLLTPKALYVIVWRITDGKDGVSSTIPWLNMLSACVPNCRVVVVATHLDHMSSRNSPTVNSMLRAVEQLTSQYANLTVTHATAVSLKKSSNDLHQLKNILYSAASGYHANSKTGVGARIPTSYKQLEQLIVANEGANVMDKEELFNLSCNKMSDLHSKQELSQATQFLHEVGSLLHYSGVNWHGLSDCYFINPTWLIHLLYKMITVESGNPFVKKGILYTKYLTILFKGDDFHNKNVSYYMSILHKLDLTVPLDQSNKFVMVPSKLPATEPTEVLQQLEKKTMYCRYLVSPHHLPHGVCGRIISRLLNSIPVLRLLLGEQAIEDKAKSLVVSSHVVLPRHHGNVTNGAKNKVGPNEERYIECNIYKDDVQVGCWAKGMFYWNHYNDVFFYIHAHEKSLKLVASYNSKGRSVLCHVITVVQSCIDNWYPGLQFVDVAQCNVCLQQHIGEYPLSHFHIEDCIDYIIRGNPKITMTCPKGHLLSLQDLIPDLLMEQRHLLSYTDCKLKRNRKRIASFNEVYTGKCQGLPAIFKPYHHGDVMVSLRQLLLEAQLLKNISHPCVIKLLGVLPRPSYSSLQQSRVSSTSSLSDQPHPFSKLESKQPVLYPMLVLEYNTLGTLDELLANDSVPRLVLYRITTQVLSAVAHLLTYRPSSQPLLLHTSDVLVTSLSLDHPVNCKLLISDLQPHHIYTKLSICSHDNSLPANDKTLRLIGTFLHEAMYLEPPSDRSANVCPFGYYYLGRVIKACLHTEPHPLIQQPRLQEVVCQLYLPLHQLVMHEVSVSDGLISCACAVRFDQSDNSDGYYEVWTCCNDGNGAKLTIFPANEMQKPLLHHVISNYQVRLIHQCGDLVWVPSWAGLESGVIDMFDVYSHKLVHSIKMKDTCISCIKCSDSHVYCGTIEGYCFMLPQELNKLKRSSKPQLHYISEHCITGLVVLPTTVWLAAHDAIYVLDSCTLTTITTLHRKGLPGSSDLIGSLETSKDRVWSVQFGGFLVSSWDTTRVDHHGDVNVYYTLKGRGYDQQGSVITAFQPIMDVMWVGVVSGHIMLLDIESGSLISLFQPYVTPVRFLISIPHFGIMTDHVILSGGRCRRHHARDIFIDDSNHDNNYLIMWEALPSQRLLQLEQLNNSLLWRNEDTLKAGINNCGFHIPTTDDEPSTPSQHPVTMASSHLTNDDNPSTLQLTVSLPGRMGRETVLTHTPVTLASICHDIKTQLGMGSHDTIELKTDTGTLVHSDNVQQLLQGKAPPPIIIVTITSSR